MWMFRVVACAYRRQKGLNPKIAFLLFFEQIRDYGVNIPLERAPREYLDTSGTINNSPDDALEFSKFLAITNYEANFSETHGFYANEYKELRPVGNPFALDLKANYKDVAGLDFTKVRMDQISGTKQYTSYSIYPTSRVVFCRKASWDKDKAGEGSTVDGYRIFGFADTILSDDPAKRSEVCTKNEVVIGPSKFQTVRTIVYPRSPQAILEYLGAILRYQTYVGVAYVKEYEGMSEAVPYENIGPLVI